MNSDETALCIALKEEILKNSTIGSAFLADIKDLCEELIALNDPDFIKKFEELKKTRIGSALLYLTLTMALTNSEIQGEKDSLTS